MSDLKIVVTGASGRMGRTLIRQIAQGSGITLCGALEMEGHPNLGLDSGTLAGMQPNGITLTADPLPLLASAQAVRMLSRQVPMMAMSERWIEFMQSFGQPENLNLNLYGSAGRWMSSRKVLITCRLRT